MLSVHHRVMCFLGCLLYIQYSKFMHLLSASLLHITPLFLIELNSQEFVQLLSHISHSSMSLHIKSALFVKSFLLQVWHFNFIEFCIKTCIRRGAVRQIQTTGWLPLLWFAGCSFLLSQEEVSSVLYQCPLVLRRGAALIGKGKV